MLLNDIVSSIPTIVVCAIALLGVWYAARGEVRRDVARESQAKSLALSEKRFDDCKDVLGECEDEREELKVMLERVEKTLADALAENRTLKEMLSLLRGSGISVSGGTVNVQGDAFGGDSTKRDEYRNSGDVTKNTGG